MNFSLIVLLIILLLIISFFMLRPKQENMETVENKKLCDCRGYYRCSCDK